MKAKAIKRQLFTFLFSILVIPMFAQMQFPSPTQNPYWIEQHGGLWTCSTQGQHGSCTGYFCDCDMPIYYKTDTLINGTLYNQLFTKGFCMGKYVQGPAPLGCPHGFSFSDPEHLLAIIRKDTTENKVFIRIGETDELLYDFNAMIVGNNYPNTITNIMNDTVVIAAEEIISINGKQLKKWQLGIRRNGSIDNINFAHVTEGIGCSFGVVSNISLPFENIDRMQCFTLNNTVLYPDTTYFCDKTLSISQPDTQAKIKIYPNPASEFVILELPQFPDKQLTYTIINSSGAKVGTGKIHDKIASIDIQSLPVGLYLIQIHYKNNPVMIRFAKSS